MFLIHIISALYEGLQGISTTSRALVSLNAAWQLCLDHYLCPSKNRALQAVNGEIDKLYGGSIRLRVCGICIENDRILLINHSLYGKGEYFWSPPGGGVQFGESAVAALEREFKEEAGLDVKVGPLLFTHEHIQAPLHAVELFFLIESYEGTLVRGKDPEISEEGQIIEEVRFLNWEEISTFRTDQLHRIFSLSRSMEDIFKLSNFISG